MKPTLSIIIPARNEAQILRSTLEKVLKAIDHARGHFIDYEIIVVDSDSHDETRHIIRGYHSQGVQYRFCSEHKAPVARNIGAQAAQGTLLLFLDADTHIPVHAIRRVITHYQRGYRAGICRLASLEKSFRARVWWWFWEHVRRLPIPKAKAMPAFMFCTRTVFDAYGPFDETVRIGEEWPILARMYRDHPHQFIYDRDLTVYTSSRRMELQYFGYLRTFLKYVWAILHPSGRIHYTDQYRYSSYHS